MPIYALAAHIFRNDVFQNELFQKLILIKVVLLVCNVPQNVIFRITKPIFYKDINLFTGKTIAISKLVALPSSKPGSKFYPGCNHSNLFVRQKFQPECGTKLMLITETTKTYKS